MSEPLRLVALLGPITVAMLLSAAAARQLVARARLASIMVAIAVVASLVTVVDLVALNHFMLINPGDHAELALVALYSLGAGVVAALIVGRSTTRAVAQLVATAQALGANRLDARAGELHASPELQLLARTMDRAAERLAALIEGERLVEAQRRDLMTSVSHDLRTPLANLRAMAEAIRDGVVREPEVLERYAGEMVRSVRALVDLVDDLFELGRLDAASFAGDGRLVPLVELVQRALDVCGPEATSRRVSLEARLGEAEGCLCSPRLGRVLHSLVDNAVRYTPAGGSVTILARADERGLEVSVEDTGAGIDGEQLPRLFEPFWRGDPARASRGSGLGQTLARRIVETLGGEIRVSSVPERGSRFDVSVPREA